MPGIQPHDAATTKLLRVTEVAKFLSVSSRYVLELIQRGDLEAIALERSGVRVPHHRVSPEALATFVATRSTIRRVKPS